MRLWCCYYGYSELILFFTLLFADDLSQHLSIAMFLYQDIWHLCFDSYLATVLSVVTCTEQQQSFQNPLSVHLSISAKRSLAGTQRAWAASALDVESQPHLA